MHIHHLLAAFSLATALPLAAQTSPPPDAHHSHHHDSSASQAPAAMTLGEVRKIDLAQGKITLRHGPIPHLNMPAMTMVFPVANPQWLNGLQAGDSVEFQLEKPNGAYQITALRPAKHAH
jgi:Cu(I)/Ag(I) efflux system periplasmic protein CusF